MRFELEEALPLSNGLVAFAHSEQDGAEVKARVRWQSASTVPTESGQPNRSAASAATSRRLIRFLTERVATAACRRGPNELPGTSAGSSGARVSPPQAGQRRRWSRCSTAETAIGGSSESWWRFAGEPQQDLDANLAPRVVDRLRLGPLHTAEFGTRGGVPSTLKTLKALSFAAPATIPLSSPPQAEEREGERLQLRFCSIVSFDAPKERWVSAGRRVVAGCRLGPLEGEVLERLLEARRPLDVREVAVGLSGERRAYTTVFTILGRLAWKGLVRKIPGGRAFVWEAAGSEDELAAAAMWRVLEAAADPQAVLARFVERASDEPKLLRRLAELVEAPSAARERTVEQRR